MISVKPIFALSMVFFAIQPIHGQWTNGTHINNTNSGNVGIGTTTPSYKLHVQGNAIFGNSSNLYGYTTIDANGNLGIGTQPLSNLALSIARDANVTAGIRFENFNTESTAFSAMQMGQAINVQTNQRFLNILYANSGITSTGIYQANGSTIYNNGNGGLTLGSEQGTLRFFLGGWQNQFERMRITPEGSLAIGTTALPASDAKLAVKGYIYAQKVKITQTGWADYVFDAGYPLRPLSEVEQYIKQHRHLPEVPSAAEVEKNGLDLGDNQATLLKKIEELTLYVIEQNKRLEKLELSNEKLLIENEVLKAKLK